MGSIAKQPLRVAAGRLCLMLVAIASAAGATAGEPAVDWQKVDAVFEKWNQWDTPGATLAVVRDGKVVYARGYGSAHLEYPIPITPSTIFHVASVSKQFACFAVVLLAEEGKLSLDDDIHKYLPDVPQFDSKITIRHLIHHTSGLRDQWQLLAMAGWRLDDVITREHILKLVRRQRELNFDPGSEHLYCNTGYTLLAEIVANASGMSFPEFTQQRIFKPLGMSNTHFHDDHEMIVPGRAYSYARQGTGYRKSVLSYANVGATSLFTTAEDLCRWLVNLDDGRVGGATAIEQMHQRGVLNNGKKLEYALGLSYEKYRGLELVGHGGADAGFRTYAVRVPAHRLGVVVLSNLASFNPGGEARKVIDVLLAEHLDPLPEKKEKSDAADEAESVAVDPEVLDRYVGLFRLDSGATVNITRAGRQLIGKLGEAEKVELVARSDREFFVNELNARVAFDETNDEPADGFTAHVGEQKLRGKRLPPQTADDPESLAGRYYSPELETTYDIALVDNQLIARHQRHSDIQLTRVGDDEYSGNQWFLQSIRFERDDDGQVTGLRAGGGRVRNLLFERRPDQE